MSDRVDTEAVRGQFPDHGQSHERYVLHRLCDEVDRTREALREWDDVAEVWQTDRTHAEVYYAVESVMRARAALAESGDTERCPTCGYVEPEVVRMFDPGDGGDPVPVVRGPVMLPPALSGCSDPWHRAARPEGETEPEGEA